MQLMTYRADRTRNYILMHATVIYTRILYSKKYKIKLGLSVITSLFQNGTDHKLQLHGPKTMHLIMHRVDRT